VEAALMNQLIAIGCSQLGDHEKFIEFTLRTAGFIQNLSYTEELRPAYDHIIGLYAYSLKDIPEAERWLKIFKQNAEQYHDLRAVGEVYNHQAYIASQQGDLQKAIAYYQDAIEQFDYIGDDKHTCRSLRGLGVCYLKSGFLEAAEKTIRDSLEKAKVIDNPIDLSLGHWFIAQIQLCHGLKEDASNSFQKAQEIGQNISVVKTGWAFLGLGRVHFSQANAQEIMGNYQTTLENDPYLVYRNPYQVVNILSKLERTFESPEHFRSFVDDYRQRFPEIQHAQLQNWYLTPADISPDYQVPTCYDPFAETISECWEWVDPLGDCSYHFDRGLIIQAANERNLHHINRSAPSFLLKKPITGDFALKVIMERGSDEKPAIGGLLLWQNEKNWLCLERGARGSGEIIFRGFKDNRDLVFGRGRLAAPVATLRLEKQGYQVMAYCSADENVWYLVGSTHIPSGEPIQPGFHANGHINRLIYPGAFQDGTAIRFRELQLWTEMYPD
jgi:tetratricopeptide (TPR) repeat protein